MVAPTSKVIPEMQGGFCKGRKLSLNTVDLDLYMRVFNCEDESSSHFAEGGHNRCCAASVATLLCKLSPIGCSEGGLLDVSKLPAFTLYDFLLFYGNGFSVF